MLKIRIDNNHKAEYDVPVVNGTRICELPTCRASFVTKRYWQKTCCKEHSRRLRYVRRRDRLMVARAMVTNRDEVLEILREGK